jgi:adenosylmethionine-8-amino-7-oxononanoate aminotransferase
LSSPWKERVAVIEGHLKKKLEACRDLPHVHDVRVLGAIGVVEMMEPVDVARIQERFVNKGVWLRPFGRLIYTMPPYIISEEDLNQIMTAMIAIIKESGKE